VTVVNKAEAVARNRDWGVRTEVEEGGLEEERVYWGRLGS
jgi:hypothetical protein